MPCYRRLRLNSAETESLPRPFRRRRDRTLRPFFDFIRARKPCLLRRLRRLGWYVRFMKKLHRMTKRNMGEYGWTIYG